MGIFTFDPGLLASFDLSNHKQLKAWQAQISQSLVQIENSISSLIQNPTYMSNLVLGTPVDLGTITTDQTVSVNGKCSIFVRLASAVTQTRIITFTGLTQGSLVFADANVTANTLTLKMAATDLASNAYAIKSASTSSGAIQDMVTTGVVRTATFFLFGMSGFIGTSATPRLDLCVTP